MNGGFIFYRPCTELRTFVRYYWVLRGDSPMNALTFPTGCPQLIFHRKSPLYIPELHTFQGRLTISGQVNFPSHLSTGGELDMIAVVFRPHTLGLFLNMPASQLYNMEISGYDIGDKGLEELYGKVYGCSSDNGSIDIIEQWLLSRLSSSLHGTRCRTSGLNLKRIGSALSCIFSSTDVSVTGLSSESCLSRKQFERIFFSLVGMNPKEYIQIVRFHRALSIMQHSPFCNIWSDIAYRCGYSDQSHFIREFKKFSGHTPSSFIQESAPYSELFNNPV
ncbi:MAG: helix-turn-helix transcriptional regulator [Bacteroidales bacterium]|nr:helix-turn-helix transcriptional regulator [Bacteroidales bacterium]